jgi:diguanylate cyclase (GGDEF)-like protein
MSEERKVGNDNAHASMAFHEALDTPKSESHIDLTNLSEAEMQKQALSLIAEQGALGAMMSMMRAQKETQEQNRQLLKQANIDGLTGIYNRHAFNTMAEYELKRSNRYKEDLGLMVLDLSGFKQINDTWGHLIGDQALISVGAMLKKNMRDSDIVARLGGDEFAVILPNTNETGVLESKFRLEQEFNKLSLAVVDAKGATHSIPIKSNIGHAMKQDSMALADLINEADQQMYTAKKSAPDYKPRAQ